MLIESIIPLTAEDVNTSAIIYKDNEAKKLRDFSNGADLRGLRRSALAKCNFRRSKFHFSQKRLDIPKSKCYYNCIKGV